MAKYTDIQNVEEGTGLVSNNEMSLKNDMGSIKKEFKILKVACVGLFLVVAYMMGTSMNVGSNSSYAAGSLMMSRASNCARVSSVAAGGFPFPDPSNTVPECTEIGNDTDECIPPLIAPVIAAFATRMTQGTAFPQKFTTTPCAAQGFTSFNRLVDIKDVVGDTGGNLVPTTLVRVYR